MGILTSESYYGGVLRPLPLEGELLEAAKKAVIEDIFRHDPEWYQTPEEICEMRSFFNESSSAVYSVYDPEKGADRLYYVSTDTFMKDHKQYTVVRVYTEYAREKRWGTETFPGETVAELVFQHPEKKK